MQVRILRRRYSSSRSPYARRWSTRILLFSPAQTPYQRLGAAGVLAPAKRQELEALYQSLNPLQLRRDLEAALDRLWTLTAPDPLRAQGNTERATPSLKSAPGGAEAMASVTLSYELTRTGG